MLALYVIFALMILWFLNSPAKEGLKHYKPCSYCTGNIPTEMTALNPFVWPMSGAQCVDDLYTLKNMQQVKLGVTQFDCGCGRGFDNCISKEKFIAAANPDGSPENNILKGFDCAPLTHLTAPDHVYRV